MAGNKISNQEVGGRRGRGTKLPSVASFPSLFTAFSMRATLIYRVVHVGSEIIPSPPAAAAAAFIYLFLNCRARYVETAALDRAAATFYLPFKMSVCTCRRKQKLWFPAPAPPPLSSSPNCLRGIDLCPDKAQK